MAVISTWAERELPVLQAVFAAEERGERPRVEDLAATTGIEVAVVGRTVAALVESRHADGIDTGTFDDSYPTFLAVRLLERGRRAIGQWPPGPSEAFLENLDRLIAAEGDPDKRSLLVKLRGSAVDVAKDVLAGAIVAAGAARF